MKSIYCTAALITGALACLAACAVPSIDLPTFGTKIKAPAPSAEVLKTCIDADLTYWRNLIAEGGIRAPDQLPRFVRPPKARIVKGSEAERMAVVRAIDILRFYLPTGTISFELADERANRESFRMLSWNDPAANRRMVKRDDDWRTLIAIKDLGDVIVAFAPYHEWPTWVRESIKKLIAAEGREEREVTGWAFPGLPNTAAPHRVRVRVH